MRASSTPNWLNILTRLCSQSIWIRKETTTKWWYDQSEILSNTRCIIKTFPSSKQRKICGSGGLIIDVGNFMFNELFHFGVDNVIHLVSVNWKRFLWRTSSRFRRPHSNHTITPQQSTAERLWSIPCFSFPPIEPRVTNRRFFKPASRLWIRNNISQSAYCPSSRFRP